MNGAPAKPPDPDKTGSTAATADGDGVVPLLNDSNNFTSKLSPPLTQRDSSFSPSARPSSPKKPLLFDYRQDSVEIPAVSLVPVPPDGDWGWIIVMSSFMTNMIVDGITYSFGILLPEFLATLGGSLELGALVGSLLVGCYLLVGPIVGGLVNKYEARPVMITGAVVACFAFFISYWADSLIYLLFTFGIMGGIGSGLIYLPGVVYVGYYFEKKRALATGISVAGSGCGAFVFPPLTAALINVYTWRGSLWIFAGIALNCAVFGALMRPLPKPKVVKEMKKHLALSRANLQASDWTLNAFKDGYGYPRKLTLRTESVYSSQISGLSPKHYANKTLDGQELSDKISRVRSGLSESSETAGFGSVLGLHAPSVLDAVKEEPEPSHVEQQAEDNALVQAQLSTNTNGEEKPEEQTDENKSQAETANQAVDDNNKDDDDKKSGGAGSSGKTSPDINDERFLPIQGPARKPDLFQGTREQRLSTATPPVHYGSQQIGQQDGNAQQQHGGAGTNSLGVAPNVVTTSAGEIRPTMSRMVSRTSRLSVRDFANSINRLNSMTPGTMAAQQEAANLTAAATVDPEDFTKPFARQDILLTSSIRNLSAFKRSGSNLRAYRESIVSVPRAVEVYESAVDGGLVAIPEPEAPTSCPCVPSTVRGVLKQMLDVELLRNWTMLLLCISNFFGFVAFYVPFVYLTSFAVSMNINKSDAALFLSIIGVTNTIGRVFYGWMSDKGWMRPITVNNLTLTACGVITVFVPLYNTYFLLTIYSALFGFLIAAFVCLTSVILVEHLGLHRLTNAFGLLILVRGIACLIGSPLAGYVYTLTSTYDASFVFSGALIILAGLVSCLIPFLENLKKNSGGKDIIDAEEEETWIGGVDRRLEDIVEGLAEHEYESEEEAESQARSRRVSPSA